LGTSPLRSQSYAAAEEHFAVPAALASIRLMTGFTWEELSQKFNVSRRAVHDWASGKQLSRKNEEAVRDLLDQARQLDTGSPASTRSLLAAASIGKSLEPLFQPEGRPRRLLSGRAREKIATVGGPLLGADQRSPNVKAPKLIKREPITVKKT
jgi:hypothetical protein